MPSWSQPLEGLELLTPAHPSLASKQSIKTDFLPQWLVLPSQGRRRRGPKWGSSTKVPQIYPIPKPGCLQGTVFQI